MKKDLYNKNKENEFQDVIKLLKDLPQVETPDSFEYNLMTKIKNKNFGEIHEEKKRWIFRRTFIPATAVVLSGILVFIFFIDQNVDQENLLMADPAVRLNANIELSETPTAVEEKSREDVKTSENLADKKQEALRSPKKNIADNQNYRVVIKPNDVVTKEKVDLPFDEYDSVNLDDILEGKTHKQTSLGRRRLVGGSNNDFYFDGFLMRQNNNRKVIEELRARRDSLIKKMREDSRK